MRLTKTLLFYASCKPNGLSSLPFALVPRMAEELQAKSGSTYTAGISSVAFVTTPNEESARKLAHSLVLQKLAACINIVPAVTSVYEWEGKIHDDNEVLMIIKTRTSRVEELAKFVRENHPYSVAEVITFPIENGNFPYLEWIVKSVPEK